MLSVKKTTFVVNENKKNERKGIFKIKHEKPDTPFIGKSFVRVIARPLKVFVVIKKYFRCRSS
jgi:hypothetical protein